MSKRLASWLGVDSDSSNNKRRRIINEDETSPAYFNNMLNNDCKVHILSFLSSDDMNSFAECSRDCRKIRANEGLNQTRKGTIIWRPGTTILSLWSIIEERRWNTVFSGNRTHLRIQGAAAAEREEVDSDVLLRRMPPTLSGVTKLDISCTPQDVQGEMTAARSLEGIKLVETFRNLRELDMSYVAAYPLTIDAILVSVPTITRLTWNGSINSMVLTGSAFTYRNLMHLVVDDSCVLLYQAYMFEPREQRDFEMEQDPGEESIYMFMHCRNLQSLSIKGSTWRRTHVDDDEPIPITQAMLIKFVRHTPTLRWLRSDLTDENIAMLEKERPEVTFVSE